MSTAETNKVEAKLAALISSFDDLEAQLEPLFAQTLPETLVGLEPLQQAKLQTVLPYLVYDLIFIYLKSKGIDPRTHPVIGELDRIRQYFDKISNAENPPTKRVEVDKAAASRFIKHAIAQSQMQWKKTAAEDMQTEAGPSSSQEKVPVKVTQKMRDRAEYEAKLKASAAIGAGVKEEEDDGLQVFDEGEDVDVKGAEMDVDQNRDEVASSKAKGKGKATDASSVSTPQVEETAARSTGANKRRRPMDPFAGYGDDATPSGSPAPSATAKKAKSSPAPSSAAPSPSGTPAPKKTKKKSKKSATAAS